MIKQQEINSLDTLYLQIGPRLELSLTAERAKGELSLCYVVKIQMNLMIFY